MWIDDVATVDPRRIRFDMGRIVTGVAVNARTRQYSLVSARQSYAMTTIGQRRRKRP